MKFKIIAVGVAALVVVGSAGATIGWYAKWRGSAPITVGVDLGDVYNYPDEVQQALDALADWSASPVVDMKVVNKGAKVNVVVDTLCDVGCTVPNYSNGVLHSAVVHINPAVFAWTDEQWVFCHEFGHTLGLGEGYPLEATGDYGSCMAGDGLHPSQQDFDVLASMYPLGTLKPNK